MTSESEIFENLVLPSEQQLQSLTKKAAEFLLLEKDIKDTEEKLKSLKQSYEVLRTKDMPEAMAACGVSAFKMQDGTELICDNFMSGSLPKDPTLRIMALDYLNSHGGEALPKDAFSIQLKMGQAELAARIESLLKELKVPYERKTDVPHGTLKKFAKEKMRKGEDVPLEKLGLYSGQHVEIVRPETSEEGL